MVRPDEDACSSAMVASEQAVSRCVRPAGASPAPVSADAPGSRPQASGEIPMSRAGCREPLRREQARGPQHEAKPAASSEKQSGSRADHVTAKVMSTSPESEREVGPGGVLGVARVHGQARNRRDPSQQPSSRQGGSYKPKVKSGAAERESEGIVVCAGQRTGQEGWSPSGARMRSAVSKSGGNASLAARGRYEEA